MIPSMVNIYPEGGYKIAMESGFEKYLNHPDRTTPDKLKTEIYVPIQ